MLGKRDGDFVEDERVLFKCLSCLQSASDRMCASWCLIASLQRLPSSDLVQRPGGVAANQWLRVVQSPDQAGHSRRVTPIAECDADVAQQAATPGALHRRATEALSKAGIVEGEQVQQARRKVVCPMLKGLQPGWPAKAPVVRTHVLAQVAAEDPVAQLRS
jgi:hypothetical protein